MSEGDDLIAEDPRQRSDPYRRHRFAVTVEGLPEIGCTEIRGLEVAVDATRTDSTASHSERWWDWRRLLPWSRTRRLSTPQRETTTPPLELWRGVTDDVVLWNWLRDWIDGEAEPRAVSVYLLDEAGDAAVGWVCQAATPVEWTGPKLTTESPGVAMEKLELTHDGFSVTTDVACDTSEPTEPTPRIEGRDSTTSG